MNDLSKTYFKSCFMGFLLLGLAVSGGLTARGQIVISKPAGEKVAVSLDGLAVGQGEAATLFMRTLRTNLDRSGWLQVTPAARAEVAVSGEVTLRRNQLHVQCRATGTADRRSFMSQSYRHSADDARRLAHRVADDLVKAITGRRGIASTRIVLVGATERARELYICDADGGNFRPLTQDGNIAVRPRWVPTGNALTYTAFLRRFPDVFHVDLDSGERRVLSNHSGLNSGGVISPDGNEMAVILSKDGNPELYVKQLRTGRLTRLTNTPQANEASPSWSPDGREIVYVSGPGGRPHLYIISRDGGRPRRVTTRGTNVSPDWGPNGLIAFSSRIGGQYQIAIMDPRTEQIRYLEAPDGADYEDPSWAPNGRHIACARRQNFRSHIYVLDTAGDPPVRLTTQRGDWYSPAWSPQ